VAASVCSARRNPQPRPIGPFMFQSRKDQELSRCLNRVVGRLEIGPSPNIFGTAPAECRLDKYGFGITDGVVPRNNVRIQIAHIKLQWDLPEARDVEFLADQLFQIGDSRLIGEGTALSFRNGNNWPIHRGPDRCGFKPVRMQHDKAADKLSGSRHAHHKTFLSTFTSLAASRSRASSIIAINWRSIRSRPGNFVNSVFLSNDCV